MKRLLAPLTALVLVATGYSLHAAGWFHAAAPHQGEASCAAADPYASEEAIRHRSCQANHWRAMLMHK